MEVVVKSRNGKVTQRQHEYIEEKLAKLERYIDQIAKVTIEVAEEQRRNEGNVHRVQVTLLGEHGMMLRAEECAPDLNAAVDGVENALKRQIKRYKDKYWRRGKTRRQSGEIIDVPSEFALNGANSLDDDDSDIPRLVRAKEIYTKPTFSDEAVEQMELLGHAFFMFRDADSEQICVVYRRRDGNYGMLVPAEGEKS
ncbi:MAG: ribosome-associated translation inhibitor RaiA [Roseiflexaceae bacterium]|nr:ribosome-associated translation inhibitor RaiA [Roseiflexaceae bacterium]